MNKKKKRKEKRVSVPEPNIIYFIFFSVVEVFLFAVSDGEDLKYDWLTYPIFLS